MGDTIRGTYNYFIPKKKSVIGPFTYCISFHSGVTVSSVIHSNKCNKNDSTHSKMCLIIAGVCNTSTVLSLRYSDNLSVLCLPSMIALAILDRIL